MLLVVEKEAADIDDEARSLESEPGVALNLSAIREVGALVDGSSSIGDCSTGSSFINFFSLNDKRTTCKIETSKKDYQITFHLPWFSVFHAHFPYVPYV